MKKDKSTLPKKQVKKDEEIFYIKQYSKYSEPKRQKIIPDSKKNGGIRGIITCFSPASRLRMIKKMKRIKDPLNCFLTLTFPDQFFRHCWDKFGEDSGLEERCKEAKYRYNLLKQKFPKIKDMWRMEIEDRKSGIYEGKYCPHFHLITNFDRSDDDKELGTFLMAWHKIAGFGNKDHFERMFKKNEKGKRSFEFIKGAEAVDRYVSKYCAKTSKPRMHIDKVTGEEKPVNIGRQWGNSSGFRLESAENIKISESVFIQVKRLARKFAQSEQRKTAKGKKEKFEEKYKNKKAPFKLKISWKLKGGLKTILSNRKSSFTTFLHKDTINKFLFVNHSLEYESIGTNFADVVPF